MQQLGEGDADALIDALDLESKGHLDIHK